LKLRLQNESPMVRLFDEQRTKRLFMAKRKLTLVEASDAMAFSLIAQAKRRLRAGLYTEIRPLIKSLRIKRVITRHLIPAAR
jgi:hypothetical protein